MTPWPPVQRPCPRHPDRIISLGPDPEQGGKHTCTWCQDDRLARSALLAPPVWRPAHRPGDADEAVRRTTTHELRVLRVGVSTWWALWRRLDDRLGFVVEGHSQTALGARNMATRAAGRDAA